MFDLSAKKDSGWIFPFSSPPLIFKEIDFQTHVTIVVYISGLVPYMDLSMEVDLNTTLTNNNNNNNVDISIDLAQKLSSYFETDKINILRFHRKNQNIKMQVI